MYTLKKFHGLLKTLERSCEFAAKDTKKVKIETDGIFVLFKVYYSYMHLQSISKQFWK